MSRGPGWAQNLLSVWRLFFHALGYLSFNKAETELTFLLVEASFLILEIGIIVL